MCGLAAIFNYNTTDAVNQSELISIRDSMLSRGPDGDGLYIEPQIGLAHRRLAIIDLSPTGAQPMANHDGTIRIVFNGEIYNYRELRQQLINKGYHFISQSDTEVLLYLYEEYDRDMVNYLRGMFTFVIWDEKRRGILLARDHFGIKPLYYANNGKSIRVASQVKALLNGDLSQIDTSIEPAGHVGFFIWGHVPDPYTVYKGISALPAGSTLWVNKDGAEQPQQFFCMATVLSQNNLVNLTSNQMFEQLQNALNDSIQHHLISDVPVGVFLSSGLDSTTLLALARQNSQNEFKTFTLGFQEFSGTEYNEMPLAKVVAKHYDAKYHSHLIQKQDFLNNLEHIYTVMDQPTIDGVNSYFVCKGAQNAGIKVALCGLGGDELFAGYPASDEIPKLVNALRMFRNMPGFR